MTATQSRLIFAAGAPLSVDVEESCVRAGLRIVATVQNRDGETFTLHPHLLRRPHEMTAEMRETPFLCALFTPGNRRIAITEADLLGLRPAAALIDASATCAASTRVDDGSFVNAGCVISAAGAVGRFVVVNRAASIGHHVEIEDFVSIGPGATISGFVKIGCGAQIGAGVVIAPRCRIGADSIVAPGTIVTGDVPPNSVAAGYPLRIRLRGAPSA